MIILFGGFLGSGRRSLAQRVAQRLNFHYYSIESVKSRYYVRDADAVRERTLQPHTDALRMHFFKKIVEDFPLLSKMYPDIVMDNAFHRGESREYFFSEAKRSFGDTFFVWIECAEEDVMPRLERMERQTLIESVAKASAQRENTKRHFKPFASKPYTFVSRGIAREAEDVETLVHVIAGAIAHPTGALAI